MRDYWKLNEDVLVGKANGKVIWQPRIDCWISDRLFASGALPSPFTGLDKPGLYRKLDVSARVYEYNGCFQPVYEETVKMGRNQLTERITEDWIETPEGRVTRVLEQPASSWAWKTLKPWAETPDDLKIWEGVERRTHWRWDQEHYEKTMAEWGRLGAPCVFLPRVNVQKLYIDLMGVENTVYALTDAPDVVGSYFEALHDSQMELISLVNRSPIKIINYGDNLHSGTLSPKLFLRYVLPEYQERSARLHEGGCFVYSHYDGNNRGLMEYYQETGMDGIEAITPVPQGDVELEEVKKYLGDMFLFDGIPAIYFDETFTVETLLEETRRIIDLFAPHLVLGISDEMSSRGDIHRIELVRDLVDAYNAGEES